MRFLLTAFIAGESLLLFLPELPSTEVWAALSISITICLLLIFFLRNKILLIAKQDQDTKKQKEYLNLLAGVLLIGFLGFSWSAYLTHERLQRSLNSELEGVDLLVTGIVDGLPSQNTEGIRFSVQVESVELEASEQQAQYPTDHLQTDNQVTPKLIDTATFPKRLSLGWYAGWGGKVQLPEIKPGQRWSLPVRLKKPHGLMNPHGFDFERWMFQQDLGANGSVRAGSKGLPRAWKPKLLDEFSASFKTYVELTRWHLRERIKAGAPDGATYVGVLIALVMGEQNAIAQSDWRVFNATGIGHLISISGLHVTMLAGMAAALANRLWRTRSLPLFCSAQKVGALSGFIVALIYTWLAGFQIPAQRTMYMVGVVAIAMWTGRMTRSFDIWWWALFVVLFLDPWAAYTPGFWLSFGAVAAILFAMPSEDGLSECGYSKKQKWWQSFIEASRVQAVVTIALLPLTLFWFSQVSIVSPLANAFAIPLISFIVTPFAMLGAVLPQPINEWSLWIAHTCMEGVAWFLKPMASWFWSVAHLKQPDLWVMALSTVGVILAIRPGALLATYKTRLLGLLCCVPLLFSQTSNLSDGEFRVTVLDIGQGTAVLIETAQHRMLYDTGPKTSPESDAGERNVLPFLRGQGIAYIDRLAISHKDTDHVGGGLSLMKEIRFGDLLGTLPEWHFLLKRAKILNMPALPCQTGQEWWWDGVLFKVWHPQSDMTFASREHSGKPNALSCVIEVRNQAYSFWLTGDVERGGELSISDNYIPLPDLMAVMLMPHHGSATSSAPIFLDAITPRWAVVQAGYRNRYRHPNDKVVQRYIAREIPILETVKTGAQIWEFKDHSHTQSYWRDLQRRTWHQ